MLIEIKQAETGQDFALIADLAADIWTEHYTPLIGSAQVEYMLATMQSSESITSHAGGGTAYCTVYIDTEPAGYLAYQCSTANRELFLSKFYVASPYRNKGVGRHMLNYLETMAARNNCRKIRLTVNKNNSDSIAAYESMGFARKGTVLTEIGNGFVMDDYELVKVLV